MIGAGGIALLLVARADEGEPIVGALDQIRLVLILLVVCFVLRVIRALLVPV